MKKWLGLLCIIFLSRIPAKADLFEPVEDRSYMVSYSTAITNSVGSTNILLISLSSGVSTGILTEWPHREVGEINLSYLKVEIDKVAASTCSVRFGVITAINTSSGSVTWFSPTSALLNVSNTSQGRDSFSTNSIFRLRVNPATIGTEGNTPYLLSNDKTLLSASGSTTYQTDVALPSASTTASTFPGVGDLLMRIDKPITTSVSVTAEIKYYTRRR